MSIRCLPGSAAHPAFRLEKSLAALQREQPGILGLAARAVYFVDTESPLEEATLDALHRLLDPHPPASPPTHFAGTRASPPAVTTHALATPRPGTISPWSSKATDIARNCGFEAVRRIERGTSWHVRGREILAAAQLGSLYDRMTERLIVLGSEDTQPAASAPSSAWRKVVTPKDLFRASAPAPVGRIAFLQEGPDALRRADARLGLALNDEEMKWLADRFGALARDPTDAELMMFAQANSEHCRHKIFNASWTVDGAPAERSLFGMIRHTHSVSPGRIVSAYRDNAAVSAGVAFDWFGPDPDSGLYRASHEPAGLVMKVETHNHPTAIAPFEGAATGSGGEIRDEAATGRGAESKAGLTGFCVSHLRIPEYGQPWEQTGPGTPPHVASPLDIMLEGPIGAARFNNEFGRPALGGFFRTFERARAGGDAWHGYHKPIMIAGGMGRIRLAQVAKSTLAPGDPIAVLGGPAMLIGLGGGAASSRSGSGAGGGDLRNRRISDPVNNCDSFAPDAHSHLRELDFASVQRDNAEMQRRCQEVINACTRLGGRNPIRSIHDVGAGGLANAIPELVHADGRGAHLDLRAIPSADPGMSPMELWCNEAQERYVLALTPGDLERLASICRRERCPLAVLGTVTEEPRIALRDDRHRAPVVDLPVDLVLGPVPRLARAAHHPANPKSDGFAGPGGIEVADALALVLKLPCVADKTFLVTIGDRSVSGLVARDQMVGPWQVPVADCAVTLSDYRGFRGEAMAMGERTPLATFDAAASARMAVGEALTNLAPAGVGALSSVALSANWMADAEDDPTALYDAVRAVGLELCPTLGIPIPVGKDSLSMRVRWSEDASEKVVTAPLSLVVSAFAPVDDVRRVRSPVLDPDCDTLLILADLGLGAGRLGGSALAQVLGLEGGSPPDAEPTVLRGFFDAFQGLLEDGLVLAYHDRSDGGLVVTLCEMAFAGRTGLRIQLDPLGPEPFSILFAEELGAVMQVRECDAEAVAARLRTVPGLAPHVHPLGRPSDDERILIEHRGAPLLDADRTGLNRLWSETSYRMQALRDDPGCAREAFEALLDPHDPGLGASLTFTTARPGIVESGTLASSTTRSGCRPAVAILREQGVNGHVELAAAFDRAGFDAIDVHMTDLLDARISLERFRGLAAGGGFSYGDVLGAGGGWAATVLHHRRLREAFRDFFTRPDTFSLGICNGCQMLSRLAALIPGADGWPDFAPNRSGQFESRLVMCEILDSSSLFLRGMAGSKLPVVVAHGEGRASWEGPAPSACIRYVDHRFRPAERYPTNPNGSPGGLTGFTTRDGRATILMPHPERTFRTVQLSWHPRDWGDESPWMQMFHNARAWCEDDARARHRG